MKPQILILWAMFASPIFFAMSGCQWRPDSSGQGRGVIVITSPDTPNLTPLAPNTPATTPNVTPVKLDPKAAPVPDGCGLLPKVTPADVDAMFDSLKRDPIPTKGKVARSDKVGIPPPALRDAAPAAGPADESYSAPRRGLFRGRLRGGGG